jgi:hypothetical protein
MADIVTLTHRNVCKDGFTVEDTADAGVFHLLSFRLIARVDHLFYSIPRPSGSVGRYRARKEGTEGTPAYSLLSDIFNLFGDEEERAYSYMLLQPLHGTSPSNSKRPK